MSRAPRNRVIPLVPRKVESPAPVPLRSPGQLPKVPDLERLFPARLATWAQATAAAIGVPVDMTLNLLLGVLSAAVAGKAEVRPWGDWSEPLNLYLAIAAEPGERKTAAFSAATRPLVEYERRLRAEAHPVILAAEERQKALAERLGHLRKQYGKATDAAERQRLETELAQVRLEADEAQVPPSPSLWTNNATPEALTALLGTFGRMGVLTDEGSTVYDNLSRYSSNGTANLSPWLEAFDGSPIRVHRKKAAAEECKGLLTAAIALQPEVLRSLSGNSRMEGLGFIQRWLFVLPQSLRGSRLIRTEPVPEHVTSHYRATIEALLAVPIEAQPRRLYLADDAAQAFELYASELEAAQQVGGVYRQGVLAGWGSKHAGKVLRLAGVLHMTRNAFSPEAMTGPISLETMAGAISLGRYFEAHARAAFDAMAETEAERDARELLEYVDGRKLERFTSHDILNVRRWRDPQRRTRALALLAELGQVVREPGRTGGEAYRRVAASAGGVGSAGTSAGTGCQHLERPPVGHSAPNKPESPEVLALVAGGGEGEDEQALTGGVQ